MTIALGMISTGGIVLAADTQVTVPGYMKTSQSKLTIGTDWAGSTCVISGAGSVGYLEGLGQTLRGEFLADHQDGNPQYCHALFEKTLRGFYRRHVIPFASWPEADQPSVDVLIAYQCGVHAKLFATEKTVIREPDNFAALGIGQVLATTLLNQFYVYEIDLATAACLAAYIIYRVKQSIDGCGHFTEICRLSGGGYALVNPEYVEALEQHFKRLERVERANLHYVLGGAAYEGEEMLRQMDAMRKEFEQLHEIRDGWWLPPQGPLDAAL
jgi:20S proteasome alpha/beta subunit